MHTECFLCFPQKAQKSQNYARALLVLACIAGYFSRTQNARNLQNGCIVNSQFSGFRRVFSFSYF